MLHLLSVYDIFDPICLLLVSVSRYWRYDEELRAIESDYPKPISRWGNVPPSPRGAFLSDDGGKFDPVFSLATGIKRMIFPLSLLPFSPNRPLLSS